MGNVNLDTAHMIAIYLSQKLCLYLYRFWDIVNYLSKLQIFLTPHLFDTPITDNPTGISTRSSAGEHYGSNVCTKICLVILTEQWLRTNTQTHRRTSIACLASCCKNYSKVLILPQSSAILLWLWYCMSLPHSSCHIISFYYWPAMRCYRGVIIRLEAAWHHRLACAGEAACRSAVEYYRRRQTTTTDISDRY